jgi:hypothetical protein
MDNQETPEQKRIKDLEVEVLTLEQDRDGLILINIKLGYSTRLLSEFHISQEEKILIGEAFDEANGSNKVKEVYEKFQNYFLNKALDENSSDFQWSPGFKENLRHYFAVSLGYDIVSEVRDNLPVITEYFALENKIRKTPDASIRKPMTEKLLKDREAMLIAMDKIINIINSFNEES